MRRVILTAAVALAAGFATSARAEEGFGFSLQGQVGAGETARNLKTGVNVVYGLILGFRFAGPLGVEADYQHAQNDVSGGPGSVTQDSIFGHVRLDIGHAALVPFLYAGVGWAHFHGSAAAVSGGVDRAVIPGGVGIEWQPKPLIVGARAEYQWNTKTIASQHVDYWKAVGTVGFQF